MAETDQSTGATAAAPSVTLPKGGGAVRSVAEKLTASAVTGSASMSVPFPASPSRAGFGPTLTLVYDSANGNGIFGLGWQLGMPSITRKTEKGLPRYLDDIESDVFIFSGAEDLVPVLLPNGQRHADGVSVPGFLIHRYRPRIEGPYARIERWTRADGDVHWRAWGADNVLTIYGRDAGSRIADPNDPRRVFSWLICETRDPVGNAVVYDYKQEDGADLDLTRSDERNRGTVNDARRGAARHIKHIRYGNVVPLLDAAGKRPRFLTAADIQSAGWMFQIVFDYGEHDPVDPTPNDPGTWFGRHDPFSSWRAGFEIRTCRLCQRILQFHHFPGEAGVGADCLVRSLDLTYRSIRGDPTDVTRGEPIVSFVAAITEVGYARNPMGGYKRGPMPPVELEYGRALLDTTVHALTGDSAANLLPGADDGAYQWVDLDGEGISGALAEQAGAWFYKRNLGGGRLAPVAALAERPAHALSAGARLVDLAGDGQLDVVDFHRPAPGFYERTDDGGWEAFQTFESVPGVNYDDPELRLIDLDGDGHADLLVAEDNVFTWYPSLAEDGFDEARTVAQPRDEEKGPRLVTGDERQAIFLADMSGDGLADIVRVRNREVCYWPNRGYGRFGPKITMHNAPRLDDDGVFRASAARLADVDGTGMTDLIVLSRTGVRLFRNESGNGWSAGESIATLPLPDDLSQVATVDLLGNGTTCLVWSSPLPAAASRPIRYVDLMGGKKPHLLEHVVSNLGGETRVSYASSTRFYLADRAAGRPWITRLPFPVHLVERVETWDHISRNRFVTRFAYHHGYFDGVEREVRGFLCVEQWDTEQFATLTTTGAFPVGANVSAESHVPPVHTRTFYHTGISARRGFVSDYLAGLLDPTDPGEYYREPGLTDAQARALLLEDTVLPSGLDYAEEREAARALKGLVLRQETFADDGTVLQAHPFTVSEQSYEVTALQPRGSNRHAVFAVNPRETITYQYERDPTDPRISHNLLLHVDLYGNTLKSASIGYGRRQADVTLLLADQNEQAATRALYTEHTRTTEIDTVDDYRTPLAAETRAWELTGYPRTGSAGRFRTGDLVQPGVNGPVHVFDTELAFEQAPGAGRQRRLIERTRTLYRPDDLGVAANDVMALLPLRTVGPLALPGEVYRLAFTPGLLATAYQASLGGQPAANLLPNPAAVLRADIAGGNVADRGGYVDLDGDGNWWMPSGRTYRSGTAGDAPAAELAAARQHFFLPRRYRDPFGAQTLVTYDAYDLLVLDTADAIGNRVTAGERNTAGVVTSRHLDYRVLHPALVTDINRNRVAALFDRRGRVTVTAVLGKAGDAADALGAADPDLSDATVQQHLAQPLLSPDVLLGTATTRIVYDPFAYFRTRANPNPEPPVTCLIARETHDGALALGATTAIQQSFVYSDGLGREIQKKMQAETGPLAPGLPDTTPRWVATGWTIYNNKGKAVRSYEPFFSATHQFEFAAIAGVSAILFYDALSRPVATLRPDHSYEKLLVGAWRQRAFDANDTSAAHGTETGDFRTDPDVAPVAGRYIATLPAGWQTWAQQRLGGALGVVEQDAAQKAVAHADTPTTSYFDTLGRTFLIVAHNGYQPNGAAITFATRTRHDITGNVLEVRDPIVQVGDARGRIVRRYIYNVLGMQLRQVSMDGGERLNVPDVTGQSVRSWNSRGFAYRSAYDRLRRIEREMVTGTDPAAPAAELVVDRIVYGERHPNGEALNLRGRIYHRLDQSGAATNDRYDFKGNLLAATRRLAKQYRTALDWTAIDAVVPPFATAVIDPVALNVALAGSLENEAFTTSVAYDALNRPILATSPHSAAMPASMIRPGYNTGGLVERLDVNLRGAVAGGQPVWTPFVTGVEYDASGRRLAIDYGNGVTSESTYDSLTHRLTRIVTRRNPATFPADCPPSPQPGWPGCRLQNLEIAYDPVGNITRVVDTAQQRIFFANRRVEPSSDYTWDPLYRLIHAEGREHLGQVAGAPIPHSPHDPRRSSIPWSANDGFAMGTYTEDYLYDAVGNLLAMQHRGVNPLDPGWTRDYAYGETSQIEDGQGGRPLKTNNRLSNTTLGGAMPPTEPLVHDAHGNVIRMPHLGGGVHPAQNMFWDYRDQLASTDLGGGGTAYYVYSSDGQRVRKVWEKSANFIEERLYFGSFELFRRRDAAGAVSLERETLHVSFDVQKVASVETRTIDTLGTDAAPAVLVRYQLTNLNGSAVLELDEHASIISYEEYSPFGSTLYQAVRSATETPRRYRFTGKERDPESGLQYHGARYYAAWLGRWTACDAAGLRDGVNPYVYVGNAPVSKSDPTGNFEWDIKQVAIGAGAALVVVGLVVVTAGVAGPILVPLAAGALGVSEATVITTVVVASTAAGAYSTTKSAIEINHEIQTGKDLQGNPVSNEQINREIGATGVNAVATFLGARGIKGGLGPPPTATAELAPVVSSGGAGVGALRPVGIELPAIKPWVTAPPANVPIATGGLVSSMSTNAMMSMAGGGGGGGSGGNDDKGGKGKTEEQSKTSEGKSPYENEELQMSIDPRASVDPLGEPFPDPLPPKYAYPQMPVKDHVEFRAGGGSATDPANIHTKTWEANARKGGFEGQYLKDLKYYMEHGMSRADAEKVLAGEREWIKTDAMARPVGTLEPQSVDLTDPEMMSIDPSDLVCK